MRSPRRRELVAVRLPLLALPAGADARSHAAAADDVHRRRHLGLQGRVPVCRAAHDVARARTRVVAVASAVSMVNDSKVSSSDGFGGRVQVVEQPDDSAPSPLGALRDVQRATPRVGGCHARVLTGPALGNDHADLHPYLHVPACGEGQFAQDRAVPPAVAPGLQAAARRAARFRARRSSTGGRTGT